LQCLREQSSNPADLFLQQKADLIRKRTAAQRKAEEFRLLADAQKKKEDHERAAQVRTLPVSEYFDVLGQLARAKAAREPRKQTKPRPSTRLFLKTTVLSEGDTLTEDELRAQRLNKDLPPIYGIRVRRKVIFPK
jgi:hypothetical protein